MIGSGIPNDALRTKLDELKNTQDEKTKEKIEDVKESACSKYTKMLLLRYN